MLKQNFEAKRRVGRGTKIAAVTAAVSLFLTGCGGQADAEGTAGDAENNASISIGVLAAPRSLDPAELDGGTQAYVWASIYDNLIIKDNAGEYQPNAAESWEYSEDGRTLTLKLRDGMTFSTGDPITSETVKASFERNIEVPGLQDLMIAVDSVEAPDESTVVINFKYHDPAFLNRITMELGVISDPATVDESSTPTDPVGSGPYILDDSTVNGSTYVLKRRDDYWNVDAYPFETVTVKVLSEQTAQLNALRSGQLDMMVAASNQVSAIEDAGDFELTYVPDVAEVYLNLADRDGKLLEPLADLRVRQAINHAFDREKIVEAALSGSATPTNQQFNRHDIAYDETLEGYYEYDPEKAKQLLAEAGYADGFDMTLPSVVKTKPYEPIISQYLADVGITVEWAAIPPQNTTAAIVAGDYAVFPFDMGTNIAPHEMQRQMTPGNTQNPFEWSAPELDELMDAALRELDPDAQEQRYKAVNRYIVENALFAPLFYRGEYVATTPGIEYLGDGTNTFPTVRQFDVSD